MPLSGDRRIHTLSERKVRAFWLRLNSCGLSTTVASRQHYNTYLMKARLARMLLYLPLAQAVAGVSRHGNVFEFCRPVGSPSPTPRQTAPGLAPPGRELFINPFHCGK